MRVTGQGQDLYRGFVLGRVNWYYLVNAHIDLGLDFYLKCINVLFSFCVDSNFEILTLANDPTFTNSTTTNRSEKTKIVGLLLLLLFFRVLKLIL
jgi:hypothetical protein